MGRCRSCKAEVVWAITAKGKRMPVDIEPVQNGSIRLKGNGLGDPRAIYVSKPEDRAECQRLGEPLYVSHFATCPDAPQHRR